MGKPASKYTYSIGGVTFRVSRPLPENVRDYMYQWADDPIWDIDNVDDPALAAYKPELLAYVAAHGPVKEAEWETRIASVTDVRAMKIAYLRGEHEAASIRAAIARVEQLERIEMHLNGIHHALMAPNAEREPVTVADLLKRIADVATP